jgi:putative ABC transport system ATP-binding protein
MSAVAARCLGLVKDFPSGGGYQRVLDGVDCEVPFGAMTLLAGPSGCGKTTLVSLLAGLLDPTAGEVMVLGTDIGKLRGKAKVRFRGLNIGFVFQQYNLLPALTAVENAAVPLIINQVPRGRALVKAAELLGRVGLAGKEDSLPKNLSGGQQQRVAIARALVHSPRLLLCDEPTAALDAASGRKVMDLLREVAVASDRAVVVVTHDPRIYGMGDRMIRMADGRVTATMEDRAAFGAQERGESA